MRLLVPFGTRPENVELAPAAIRQPARSAVVATGSGSLRVVEALHAPGTADLVEPAGSDFVDPGAPC
ncbi:hypothetical protein [Pseudonocardia lacus]|uniref:hypothetical protein n=1 Tax=Pseudonocardia lacus TaxID=2835865 RepID=UPI001BDBCF1E|nr:hypothetical protein [Pseudonocardia lacus]